MSRKILSLILSVLIVATPALGAAAPRIRGFYGGVALPYVDKYALPGANGTGANGTFTDPAWKGIGSIVASTPTGDSGTATMDVNQNQPRAIIDWNSFNIGANAWVRFNQKDSAGKPMTNWIALNRIQGGDPSRIFGKLTADGKVYLINRNGILFAPGSQVNVHSLTASSLKLAMADLDFLNAGTFPTLHFSDDLTTGTAPGVVSNQGTIRTDRQGEVFLISPDVENGGTITVPNGQIVLAAGTDVSLQPDSSADTTRGALLVTIHRNPGKAWNLEDGSLITESGMAGMYGREVEQDGLIRSVTAVKQNGQIELLASDRIVTGRNSVTETPISDSPETVAGSYNFTAGKIVLSGFNRVLDSGPVDDTNPAKAIELNGVLSAPSGTINLKASDRVYLETGSKLDVSGVWIDRPATDTFLSMQMNSENLRDAFGQKDGVLKGKNIIASMLTGTAIGDISGTLLSRPLTAMERSTTGGSISVDVTTGRDIIVREGAGIDFAGGGTHYQAGGMEVSKLVSGNQVFDISNAPSYLAYSQLLGGEYKEISPKFGITNALKGTFYGGGLPVRKRVSRFDQGSDAGSLTLKAPKIVLDGRLNGRVVSGPFQTLPSAPLDKLGNPTASGTVVPMAGSLILGTASNDQGSQIVNEVEIRPETAPLPSNADGSRFTASDALADPWKTVLSAKTLNDAGLGKIEIDANTRVTVGTGASISEQPGGSFTATARRIEHYGEISAPAGSVTLTARDNLTTAHPAPNTPEADVLSWVFLADGSRISTAGEKVDNSPAATANGRRILTGRVDGGSVSLQDQTDSGDGVYIKSGALVDVSGGYLIDTKGKIAGGNAGALDLQGSVLIADGDLRGFSLPGKNGGSVTLHSTDVEIASTSPAKLSASFSASSTLDPTDERLGNYPGDPARKGKLLLAADRFKDTGFTNIAIKSRGNIALDGGVTLSPSETKADLPIPGGGSGNLPGKSPDGTSFGLPGSPDFVGPTSVSLAAGVSFTGSNYENPTGNLVQPIVDSAKVEVSSGAVVRTVPKGSINITGPTVDIAGTLEAPAGTISVKASEVDLTVTGRILADGVDKAQAVIPAGAGVSGATPLPGGSVTFEAANGSLLLGPDSRVSVNGAPAVENRITGADGSSTMVSVGGDAGSISLTYLKSLSLQGVLEGKASPPGSSGGTANGGSLLIRSKNLVDGMTVTADQVQAYQGNGFDDLTLASWKSLDFVGGVNTAFGRKLTLDAPRITASGQDTVKLEAPWVRLTNNVDYYDAGSPAAVGGGSLALSGEWIDVEGITKLSGFQNVLLDARRDIRFSDKGYLNSNGPLRIYPGDLATAADLTLRAARIYPTTQSVFTVRTDGKLTIEQAGAINDPIYSAGGNLTLNAKGGIEDRGTLAAPFGTLSFNPDPAYKSRVYLADGSVTTTAGSGLVSYGFLDDDLKYRITDKNVPGGLGVKINGEPAKNIALSGTDVIVMKNARIDDAGGGTLFAYQFQPGIEGSVNPLTTAGRYVIVPDGSVKLPGNAVYLSGGAGIPAGTYSLLPPEFAFLPGAVVIADLGSTMIPGQKMTTREGFPIVGGFMTTMGTDNRSPIPGGFSVRPASDVLKEGHFEVKRIEAGSAGTVSVMGDTTIFRAAVDSAPLPGSRYSGGTMALSGKDVTVRPGGASPQEEAILDGLTFGSSFGDTDLQPFRNGLLVDSGNLAGKGLKEIRLGNVDPNNLAGSTSTVTVKAGSTIDAPVVTLAARDAITLEGSVGGVAGSLVNAVGASGDGVATFTTPGKLTIGPGAAIHTSDQVQLNVGQIDVQGTAPISVDPNSTVSSIGIHALGTPAGKIFFVPDGYVSNASDESGVYLTGGIWNGFSGSGNPNGFKNISLAGSDLVFRGDFDLRAPGSLSIDAARIAATAGTSSVSLTAQSVSLMNSGSSSGSGAAGSGALTIKARKTTAGRGDILLDGFSSVDFKTEGDFTMKGRGSITSVGDMTVEAARVTTGYTLDAVTNAYQSADFLLSASGGMTFARGSGGAGATSVPGGSVEVSAERIVVGTDIVVDAGRITLNATGTGNTDGITVKSGSTIRARGVDAPQASGGTGEPGGRVALNSARAVTVGTDAAGATVVSEATGVTVEPGATIDVSTEGTTPGNRVDAGYVAIRTPGKADLQGEIKGGAANGKGGSFALDTVRVANLSTLTDKLHGFTESVDIRARKGDLALESSKAIKSRAVRLTADGGSIDISGTIDASGDKGGRVALNANTVLAVSGSIDAHASGIGADGGEVRLSTLGELATGSASVIDVSAGPADPGGSGSLAGKGGTVYFRAPRTASAQGAPEDDVNMTLGGTVKGASRVAAEGFKEYEAGTIGAAQQNAWLGEAASYMGNAAAIRSRRFAGSTLKDPSFVFLPGIEVQSAGDLNLNTAWDFTTPAAGSYSGPGMLTLRAAGNLNINTNLVDHPTAMTDLNRPDPRVRNSWGFTLVAGSDRTSADSLGVVPGTGTLAIGSASNGSHVYTESAPIRFASGGNTELGVGTAAGYMINNFFNHTLASYDGGIRGYVGGDLKVNGGAIQTASGDIDVTVGGNLSLGTGNSPGAIRTTGAHPPVVASADGNGVPTYKSYTSYMSNYSEYRGGGDISLDVDGSAQGALDPLGWDAVKNGVWSASYQNVRFPAASVFHGIGAMGGGSVEIHTGGDYFGQAGTFGKGDLRIFTGGNLQGRFLVKEGLGVLHTMGDFGDSGQDQAIEAFAAQIDVSAQGSIGLGTVVNPTIARPAGIVSSKLWNPGYARDSMVSLFAHTGDVVLTGKDIFYTGYNGNDWLSRVLPPRLEIRAGRDIRFADRFDMAPSPRGSVFLEAGRDIDGTKVRDARGTRSAIAMSDYDPDKIYKPLTAIPDEDTVFGSTAHDPGAMFSDPLRKTGVVSIHAGGDIRNMMLYLPKAAEVVAGRDIQDVYFVGQNLGSSDVTSIRAGRDIYYTTDTSGSSGTSASTDNRPGGIELGGPGALIVEAGNDIDLGSTKGIQAYSNANNLPLGTEGSTLIVAAGIDRTFGKTDVNTFFSGLQADGTEYSNRKAQGDTAKAQEALDHAHSSIEAFFGGPVKTGSGNIALTSSQIKTTVGKNDLYILATGKVDVGKNTIVLDKSKAEAGLQSTGIITDSGGGINIFTRGDLNVNEARVMTFLGGDITAWSDQGNVNAGRGSKAAISAEPPHPVKKANGTVIWVFNPPAVGSGIRTLTYSPGIGVDPPEAGNVYLFAPKGSIDAGEAGIAGNKVILGATQVLNANNISFSGGSVGVPASEGSVSIGALSGAGGLTDSARMIEQATSVGSSASGKQFADAAKVVDEFVARWLDVQVIDFFDSDEQGPDADSIRKKKE